MSAMGVLDTLSIGKDTFVGGDQREHYSDMLYSVRLVGGKSAYVYLLFEHKSSPARFVALQLLRYMLEILELHRKQNEKSGFRATVRLLKGNSGSFMTYCSVLCHCDQYFIYYTFVRFNLSLVSFNFSARSVKDL